MKFLNKYLSPDDTAAGGSGGASGGSSGTTDDKKPNDVTALEAKIAELLKEKKTVSAENAEFKRKEKEASDAKLIEQGEYKKIIALREEELKTEREKSSKLTLEREDGLKFSAFRKHLSGGLESQYTALVDLDSVTIDPTTGLPDESSAKKAAEEFEKKYPKVIDKKVTKGKMPNDAAPGGTGKLSYDAWLKLPYKEQVTRQKDVSLDE